jgi:hypothetical protein
MEEIVILMIVMIEKVDNKNIKEFKKQIEIVKDRIYGSLNQRINTNKNLNN